MNMSEFFILKSNMCAIISNTLKYTEKVEGINKGSNLWLLLVIYLIIIICKKSHCIFILSLSFLKFQIFYKNEILSFKIK